MIYPTFYWKREKISAQVLTKIRTANLSPHLPERKITIQKDLVLPEIHFYTNLS